MYTIASLQYTTHRKFLTKMGYLLRSKGTRSASRLSHCWARWLTHREHAKIRPWESMQAFSEVQAIFRKHGKCIA